MSATEIELPDVQDLLAGIAQQLDELGSVCEYQLRPGGKGTVDAALLRRAIVCIKKVQDRLA